MADPKNINNHERTVVNAETGWVTIRTKAKLRSSVANRRAQNREASSLRTEYWLRERRAGSWRIAKIRFDGVDLNKVFGSQFASMLKKSTPEEVLTKLRELNTRRDATNPLE